MSIAKCKCDAIIDSDEQLNYDENGDCCCDNCFEEMALECPQCGEFMALIDKQNPSLLNCHNCQKSYELKNSPTLHLKD